MTALVTLLIGLAAGAAAGWLLLQRERNLRDDDVVAARFGAMRADLDRVAELVQELERNRSTSYGRLEEQLEHTSRTTVALADTTQALRTALAAPQSRGAWGERMAADVLRHAGFVEGINYLTQQTLPSGGRPDITFPLPGDRQLHMDVKFPLDNYLRALETTDDDVRARLRRSFLRDVRQRIREITSRDYADPSTGSLDYVLLFLPNEHVYAYVHQHDPSLLDEAMAQRVILCSPLTLLAVLAVVRETVDNFALERASHEVLGLLGGFRAEWDRFGDAIDLVDRRLASARKAFDDLAGVRSRGIERQLARIDQSQRAHGLPVEEGHSGLRAIGD